MDLGERIQQLRKDKNLSQEQLAERLQISRQSVSKWEAGQSTPELDKIIQLSEIFDVTTDYLLKGITEENRNTVSTDRKGRSPADYSRVGPVLASGITILGLIAMLTLRNTRFGEFATGIGFVIQIIGCIFFEVAACLQKGNGNHEYIIAHLKYYALNVWFLMFILLSYIKELLLRVKTLRIPIKIFIFFTPYIFVLYILICAFITGLLAAIIYVIKKKGRS